MSAAAPGGTASLPGAVSSSGLLTADETSKSDGSPRCTLCGHPLYAAESVRRGYGLDCAKRHRLPYGVDGLVPSIRSATEQTRIRNSAWMILVDRTVPEGFDRDRAMANYLRRGFAPPAARVSFDGTDDADERWATFRRAMGRQP